MRGFAKERAADSSGLLALLGVALLFLLGDTPLREEPLAELGYALVLLSALGVAVYSGNLVRNLLGSRTGFFGTRSFMQTEARLVSETDRVGRERPVVVSLLLSSLSFLFAGLAGWVYGDVKRV